MQKVSEQIPTTIQSIEDQSKWVDDIYDFAAKLRAGSTLTAGYVLPLIYPGRDADARLDRLVRCHADAVRAGDKELRVILWARISRLSGECKKP